MDKLENLLPDHRETTLVFFVNGKKVIEKNPDPELTLLWYLRKKLHLTGTKYGCGEGGCGACTVMLSQCLEDNRIKHLAVNACLTPLCAVHGLAVTTVEGIGSTEERLHAVQERIAKSHGSQCGFCTPGIVMSMYTLLRNKNKINYNNIEYALQGNLCRCTGYRPITEAFKTFIEPWENNFVLSKENGHCAMGERCCRLNNNIEPLVDKSKFQPYCKSQEPIFPPELKLKKEYGNTLLYYKGSDVIWIRPTKLKELLQIKDSFPNSKIVVGNTEIGVEVKYKRQMYPLLLSPVLIREMNIIRKNDRGIEVGAAVSLSELDCFLQNMIMEEGNKLQILKAIKSMLHWFAGNQVRNVASLAGNIVTASPVSDLNPILMACSAIINVTSIKTGSKKIVIDSNFFTSYRKVAIADDEVVLSVEIPFTEEMQFFKAYKQSRRRDDDITIVTAAFNLKLIKNSNRVAELKICYGGVAPVTVCAMQTSNALVSLYWNEELLQSAFENLSNELKLDDASPGGMALYRKSLSLSLFFRFYLYISNKLSLNGTHASTKELSGAYEIPAAQPLSAQCFEIKQNKSVFDSIGKPIAHVSALKQATGEAIYCDDLPVMEGELFLCLVISTESHAKIISIDPSKALALPDVVAFFSAEDLCQKRNKMGPYLKDEEVFASDIVTSRACVIGAVVAKSEKVARQAKYLINITYEKQRPVIVTIEDAIAYESFYPGYPQNLKKGNPEEALSQSSYIVEGHIRNGAQEHFYLETISAFAIRKEDELEIVCTTQNPADIAKDISFVLGIPIHQIVSKVKRIGGGFGGKGSRVSSLALPVAVAAYKLKKPIRAVLDRDEDMLISGNRHPFLIKYKTGFDEDGRIKSSVFNIYVNAGYSMDISSAMLLRAIMHVDNSYFIPNVQVNGYLCKTNLPSNTAFRGFGSPKAMLAAESIIRDIAAKLNKPFEDIIELNLYKEGDLTHYNQTLTRCTLARCWDQCLETSNYLKRKKSVDEFNSANRWQKKGLSIVPTKYGISFRYNHLMQAGALLLIYTDGTVLLSVGGIEMGQGLFTKMIQIAAKCLDIDVSKILISEMATDKIPNSVPTGASLSSDMYGMAVIDACNILNKRLDPYKGTPDSKWEDWISAAYMDRVCLSAIGFYTMPKVEYNPETNSGKLHEYFTYGAACSEVVIDCLTGDHQVLRTDIVMDIGESINPAIDIGQIEGAFMQGYGFYTIEEMLFSPSGEVLTKGPGTYKIPGFSDIPKEFNVSLLKGAPNPSAVYSSKAVGEPPIFLAASVFFAIKEAIKSARIDAGASSDFFLEVPATCARIRMACVDSITEMVKATTKTVDTPWSVTP